MNKAQLIDAVAEKLEVSRRAAGEPLQYVLGRWGFRQLDLMVDRRALIPRPETEQVVEVALGELRALGREGDAVVTDLGTGSGAIALSLAKEGKVGAVWATDVSPDAIAVARAESFWELPVIGRFLVPNASNGGGTNGGTVAEPSAPAPDTVGDPVSG